MSHIRPHYMRMDSVLISAFRLSTVAETAEYPSISTLSLPATIVLILSSPIISVILLAFASITNYSFYIALIIGFW